MRLIEHRIVIHTRASHTSITCILAACIFMFLLILIATIYYVSYRLYQHYHPSADVEPRGKYVFISVCDDGGVGQQLAIELDQQGFTVLAGVSSLNNIVTLNNKLSTKAAVFSLDVTKQEDIDASFELVRKKTNTLHALINNSEITAGHLIDWTSIELMRKVMDVNYFAHVAVTKTFLPLLIAQPNSRVINICSVAGYLAVPGISAYCSAKSALESFSDCLRREMAPWGLRVCIIEPGSIRSSLIEGIGDNIKKLWKQLSSDVQQRWGVNFLNNTILQSINSAIVVNAENPNKVVRAMRHAVLNTKPCIRYRPGWQSKTFFLLSSIFPTKVMDILLNIGECSTPAGVRNQLTD